ncbi:thiol peroxidase [Clostridium celatum]|uniref:Thiol peroxidase n=1 Tax=Clostridium celatum DSM 1785 TaxID=545697 RepID=L1QEB2_9CLOT|nr:thiol peroxidase [Clostridium celatum]EKY26303.1 redoxin family protein [Clostridium celatum DSM 1785]MCE9653970.1 thiol peroxidase [Clostridium celatum]MDU2264966.1 thiol peroxidase [Clostridium celatum]MDU3723181.1 thiol peroxidase [Clostridium celatum]MDU6294356.1 thiol peroxidase [Clostridium celatum]
MKITFNGDPITLVGPVLRVGDDAPDFLVVDNTLKNVTLKDTSGKRIFVVVPSIDTSVCDMEVRKFNEEASKLSDVTVYVVSMDLPFAQVRWCGNAGIDKVITVSDYKQKSFGKKYGTLIEEFGFLARAIFVVDENNKITYVEYCKDVINEPDYESALNAVK